AVRAGHPARLPEPRAWWRAGRPGRSPRRRARRRAGAPGGLDRCRADLGPRVPAVMSGVFRPLGWAMVRAPLLPVEDYEHLPTPPADPRAETALAVGSASLFDAVEAGRDDRVASKQRRYFIRMSTRTTPFGLFAGVGLVRFAPSTDVAIGPD